MAAHCLQGGEARHAASLNVLTGTNPYPDAVNAPLTKDEVRKAAGPLMSSAAH